MYAVYARVYVRVVRARVCVVDVSDIVQGDLSRVPSCAESAQQSSMTGKADGWQVPEH